jgi:chemotaxis protein CheD
MAIRGFESYRKIWDPSEQCNSIKILPGEFFVSDENDRIETILGSCIAACIRDPIRGVGGMNHFMLPIDKKDRGALELSDANRFGNFAMENLINAILRSGGRRENLEVKLFGGGRIMNQMTNIGWYNIGFVLDYLNTEGYSVVSQDMGDIYPRKVHYYPKTGRVRVRRLNAVHNESLIAQETSYQHNVTTRVQQADVSGDVELF